MAALPYPCSTVQCPVSLSPGSEMVSMQFAFRRMLPIKEFSNVKVFLREGHLVNVAQN